MAIYENSETIIVLEFLNFSFSRGNKIKGQATVSGQKLATISRFTLKPQAKNSKAHFLAFFFRQFNAIGPRFLFIQTFRSFRLSEGERRVRVSH